MKNVLQRISTLAAGIAVMVAGSSLAQALPGSFPGVTIQAKIIGGELYEKLYTRIAEWEKLTGAKVDIVSKKNYFELDKEIKADMAAGVVNWCVGSNHTSFAPGYPGLYTDLSKLLPQAEIAQFVPANIAASKLKNSLVMLPRAQFDVSATYYRLDLYNDAKNKTDFKAKYGYDLKPPVTLKEFKDQSIFFTKAPNLYGTQYPGKEEAIVGRFFEVLIAEGGAMFDDNFKPTFNSAAGERALQFFVDLYKAGAVPKGVINYLWDDLGNGFASGSIAVDHDWPGWAGFFNDPKNSKVAGKVGVAPSVKGPSGKRLGWSGAHGFSVTEKCANKPAAASLAWFLTNYDSQMSESRSGSLPTRTKAWTDLRAEVRKSGDNYRADALDAFSDTAEGAYPVPQTPYWIEATSKMYPELQAAILGQKTVKQALADAAKAVADVMK